MTNLDDALELLGKYDELDVGNRINDGGQALLIEVRTRALVSIAESLNIIAADTDHTRRRMADALDALEIQGRR